jgi:hypothetical protein
LEILPISRSARADLIVRASGSFAQSSTGARRSATRNVQSAVNNLVCCSREESLLLRVDPARTWAFPHLGHPVSRRLGTLVISRTATRSNFSPEGPSALLNGSGATNAEVGNQGKPQGTGLLGLNSVKIRSGHSQILLWPDRAPTHHPSEHHRRMRARSRCASLGSRYSPHMSKMLPAHR